MSEYGDFNGKLRLLMAGYEAALAMEDTEQKRELFGALFWICDLMRGDVIARCDPRTHNYNVATIELLREFVSEMFKDGGRPVIHQHFREQWYKIQNRVPDIPEHDQEKE